MIRQKINDTAFTGLEAAIVLIAFVVVAAVFSYVVLGAGFYTTQKAQEAVYTAIQQGTSNIQMVGQVYGLSTSTDSNAMYINQVQFFVGLAPGATSIDLSLMKLVFSTPTASPLIYTYDVATVPTGTKFAAMRDGATQTSTLSAQQQVRIAFMVSPAVPKNTVMNFEIRPPVGAALPFTKTSPAEIVSSNVLY